MFEYLATGRPTLAIAPNGEAWDLLRPYPGAACFEPKDVAGIAAWLERSLAGKLRGGSPEIAFDASPYSRDSQARQLGEFLDEVCAAHPRRLQKSP